MPRAAAVVGACAAVRKSVELLACGRSEKIRAGLDGIHEVPAVEGRRCFGGAPPPPLVDVVSCMEVPGPGGSCWRRGGVFLIACSPSNSPIPVCPNA